MERGEAGEAAGRSVLKPMQQADLQLNYNNLRFERFEDGQLGANITGQHELFEQVIEMADQPILEAESVLPGQASMIGSSPLPVGGV
jgi:hypothetical protein